MKKILLGLAAALLVYTGAFAVQVGDPAPNFTLHSPMTNAAVSFDSATLDKPAVVVFFNTTCGACDREMQMLKGYVGAKPDALDLYLVAVDAAPGSAKRITQYASDKGIKGAQVLWDANFEIAEKFGFGFTPATVGVAKDGTVAFTTAGYSRRNQKDLEKGLDELTK